MLTERLLLYSMKFPPTPFRKFLLLRTLLSELPTETLLPLMPPLPAVCTCRTSSASLSLGASVLQIGLLDFSLVGFCSSPALDFSPTLICLTLTNPAEALRSLCARCGSSLTYCEARSFGKRLRVQFSCRAVP